MEHLVSIVVPVYNAERYLCTSIHALQKQDYSNIEIILVDDGSKDASPSICDSFEKEDKRIRAIHKTNGGVSSARNAGIEAATGKYIMFVDSDDLCESNIVSRMVFLAEHWNVNFVICGFRTVNDIKSALNPIRHENTSELVYALSKSELMNSLGYMIMRRPTMFAPWNKLFDLEIIRKNNIKFIPTVSYGEDFLFNLEYLKYCNGAIETNEKLYNYILQNPDSLEAKYKSDLFENQTMLYKAAKQVMIDNSVYEGDNIYNLDCYYVHRLLYCIEQQDNLQNYRTNTERQEYVASFCRTEDAINAVYNANLTGEPAQRIFTDLIKTRKFTEVYDAVINCKKGIDDETYKLRYVRYKIQDDGPNIVGSRQKIKWVFYSFKSIKKYGLVITLKRISGKINRKFGR